MRAILFFICLFSVETIFAESRATSKLISKKPVPKVSRNPNQQDGDQEDLLLSPHNCRVVVNAVLTDRSEKVWIYPYNVQNENECRVAKKTHQVSQDPAIVRKDVVYFWLGEK